MGDPSDDDVPTMTSSAELRRDGDGSGADADDRTIQKPPEVAASVPRPAAGLSATATGKLPPPPSHPLRPRLPSSPSSPSSTATGPVTPAMRPRVGSTPGPLGQGSRPIATPLPMGAKAEAAKMEVANPDLAKKDPAKSDSKSDVRAVTSARSDDDLEGPPTLESEPPPSEPATSPKSPAMIASSPAPHTPHTPKMPTAPTTPSAPAGAAADKKAPRQSPPDAAAKDGDPSDDSITATAPRVPAPIIPLSAPRSVEIRTLDDVDDSADETEVKTLSAEVGELVRSARDRVRVEKGGAEPSEADVTDDSVTAQAPAAPAPAPAQAQVIRIGAKSLMPQAGGAPSGAPSTNRGGAYNPDEEDSVTARSLAVGADYRDDSVTTQSPSVAGGPPLPAPIDGETEGTTKRVRKKGPASDPNASEADERDDSVTAAAPGHLTNMLRVIASPSEAEEVEDDDALQAHTQVMLNAPVKPPVARMGGPTSTRGEPTSESGLRVADEGPSGLGGDRASLGALGVAPHEHRHSAPMRAPMTSDPSMMGPSPSDRISRAPFPPMPMPHDVDRKPPYAVLVGVVAAISVAIPVILYIVLSSGADIAPRVTSQPSPDPVGVTGARPKAGKAGPSGTPSGQRPTNNGNNGRPSPFRR